MEPSKAMIEAGAEAMWDLDPHRIRWAELREATKSMARIQAAACLRAAMVGVVVNRASRRAHDARPRCSSDSIQPSASVGHTSRAR